MLRAALPVVVSALTIFLLSLSPVSAEPAPGLADLVAGANALEQGRAAEALPVLQRSASVEGPVRDLAWLLLGRAALETGDAERALAASALVSGAVPGTVRGADADWLHARALTALGRHGEAAEAWRSFSSKHPRDGREATAELHRAESLQAAGRTAEAARAWRELALDRPATAPEEALERARALHAEAGLAWVAPSGSSLLERADALADANLHARAVRAYAEAEAALGDRGGADAALVRKARSLYRLRRNDESAAACEELARRFPGSNLRTAALHRRARVAWRQDDGETLLAATAAARDEARHRASSWRDDLLHVRAGYFMEKKRWEEAIEAFEQVRREHPESKLADDSLWKSAWCRLDQGRVAEAARRFEELADAGREEELVRGASYWAGVLRGRLGEREASRARLESTYRRWPFRYHGVLARELLAGFLTRPELAALDAEVEAGGEPFVHPGAFRSADPRAGRYALLREAGLHDFALDELEDLRREVEDGDALIFELAQARSRSGRAASGHLLLAGRFWKALERPSRRSDPRFWEVAYPRPFGEELDRLCARRGLDAALASGLIRSESWWNPSVRSSADARGLMQLIPSTARRVARQEGLDGFDPARLFEPELNLRLGTRYLADLLGHFGGDAAAAVASYNAGEDKVEGWWRAFDAQELDFAPERVARIPYRETRRYVRRVLEAAAWYRWLDGPGAGRGPVGEREDRPVGS